jgi:hypothetical protein
MDISREQDTLTALSLIADVQAIGEGLLEGDLVEARFRTAQIALSAQTLGYETVRATADKLSHQLAPPQGLPGAGIGAAYVALAASVDALLGHGASD